MLEFDKASRRFGPVVALNNRPQEEADEVIEVLLDGSMPPAYYTRFGLHPTPTAQRPRTKPTTKTADEREQHGDDD